MTPFFPGVCPYSGDRQALQGIVAIAFFLNYLPDPVDGSPHAGKTGVERRQTHPDIVRLAKVGQDGHLFDQRAVDAVALRMADADVRATASRIARRPASEFRRLMEPPGRGGAADFAPPSPNPPTRSGHRAQGSDQPEHDHCDQHDAETGLARGYEHL